LDKVILHSNELGRDFSLSPEHWLSRILAKSLSTGAPLVEIVELQKKGTTKISATALVLDTGNSDRGLFILPFSGEKNRPQRTSNKKLVPEGAVLISRLRPYLQQVVYVPHGICSMLGVSEVLCSTEYYVLAPKEKHSIAFLVPWLLSDEVQSVFEQATTGGHHPRFNDDLLMGLFVPDAVMENLDEISESVERLVVSHLKSQVEMRDLIRGDAS